MNNHTIATMEPLQESSKRKCCNNVGIVKRSYESHVH